MFEKGDQVVIDDGIHNGQVALTFGEILNIEGETADILTDENEKISRQINDIELF